MDSSMNSLIRYGKNILKGDRLCPLVFIPKTLINSIKSQNIEGMKCFYKGCLKQRKLIHFADITIVVTSQMTITKNFLISFSNRLLGLI